MGLHAVHLAHAVDIVIGQGGDIAHLVRVRVRVRARVWGWTQG